MADKATELEPDCGVGVILWKPHRDFMRNPCGEVVIGTTVLDGATLTGLLTADHLWTLTHLKVFNETLEELAGWST